MNSGLLETPITAALEAAAATADTLNAFITVDRHAAERTPGAGPLSGVPIALKDIIDHAGHTTTAGSSFYRHAAETSATCVTRLEAAGAVIVGRTGLHEFAFGFSSENDWFGPVRNPWDTTTSPGGSSGGSAAAVAAGIVPIAIGTDTGGSIRVPAALCGCVGLKVTHGRIPLTGVFPLAASLDTVGPIARTVSDVTTAYLAMAGDDPADPWAVPRPVASPRPVALSGLRVAVPHPWVDRPLDPAIAAGLASVRAGLSDLGVVVTDIRAPELDPEALPRAAYAEVAAVHRRWITEHPERYGLAIRDRLLADLAHEPDAVSAAQAWRAGLRHALRRRFGEADLLLTPTTASRRKEIGVDTVTVAGTEEPYRQALSWFTTLVNQSGLPAIALPVAGTAGEHLPPVSIQLIAPWWDEAGLLAFAAALEDAGIVGFTRPFGLRP